MELTVRGNLWVRTKMVLPDGKVYLPKELAGLKVIIIAGGNDGTEGAARKGAQVRKAEEGLVEAG